MKIWAPGHVIYVGFGPGNKDLGPGAHNLRSFRARVRGFGPGARNFRVWGARARGFGKAKIPKKKLVKKLLNLFALLNTFSKILAQERPGPFQDGQIFENYVFGTQARPASIVPIPRVLDTGTRNLDTATRNLDMGTGLDPPREGRNP